MKHSFLRVPIYPHWMQFLATLIFSLEYARIVFFTDAPRYKVYVLSVLLVLFAVSATRVVLARRKNRVVAK